MPRTRSLAWSELKIGVLTIVAIAIAAVLIFSLTGARGFFWQRYTLKTRFASVTSLAPGSPVRVAGKEVGQVKSIDFAGEQIDVTFEVHKEVREKITDRSVAVLGSVSLLGEGAVDITPSTSGTRIPEWGYVPAGRPPAQLADVASQAAQGVDQITKLVEDVRAGKGTVGQLMTNEQLYQEVHRFVAAANEVTRGIQRGRGTVGRLVNDPKTARALEASLVNLERMTKRINAGEGTLGKLLNDDALGRSLTDTTANMQKLTANLNSGRGSAGKLMTDEALYNRLNSLAERFDQLLNRLNDGQGTAGQLLNNKQLYENMNKTISELGALLTEIKQNPKKYLNVKVSIW